MSPLTDPELRVALDRQIEYTGQLQVQIDQLQLKCDDYRAEIRMREEREAELEAALRAIRKLTRP